MVHLRGKKAILLLGDMSVFFAALYVALSLRRWELADSTVFFTHTPFFFLVLLIMIGALYIIGLYDVQSLRTSIKLFSYTLYSVIASGIGGVALFYLFPSEVAPKLVLLIHLVVLLFMLFAWRLFFERVKLKSLKTKALLIGEGKEYEELKKAINEEKHYPIVFVEHLLLSAGHDINETSVREFHQLLKRNSIRIIVADIKDKNITGLLPYLYNAASDGVLLYDMRRLYQDVFRRMPLTDIGYFWFFENVSFDTKLYETAKRFFDVCLGLIVLVPWLVIHPFVALAVRREDGGRVFIKQERLGRHGRVIKLYKYRTMTFNDQGGFNGDGTIGSTANKVTKIGAFLRKTRIDELPQVLAVITGDLSLIGPRAELVDIGRQMAREMPFYMMRYSVRPGLSGWAQVNQDDGSPRGVDAHMRKLEYDFFYIKNRSLLLDTIIALKTIRTLLLRSGV